MPEFDSYKTSTVSGEVSHNVFVLNTYILLFRTLSVLAAKLLNISFTIKIWCKLISDSLRTKNTIRKTAASFLDLVIFRPTIPYEIEK